MKLRAETGSRKNNLLLSFTEPWIFDHPISGGFDLFRRDRERDDDVGYAYDEKRVGGDIRFGKEFSEYVKGNIMYKLEEIEIDNLKDNVSQALLDERGENRISMLAFGIRRDTRDSIFNTTKGYVLNGNFDIAGGALGGDKDFYRWQGRGNYYIPLKYDSVLEFRGHMGIVNDYGDSNKVPIFERFFAGGAKTIRGYNERKVGPLDNATEDPIGGESIFVANIEYKVPVLDFI